MIGTNAKDIAFGEDVAVKAICDMAVRRGLHASRIEAEQAWRDVKAPSEPERLAAAWRWLFDGHTLDAMPLSMAQPSELPAWVMADGAIGVVKKLATDDRPAEVEWFGRAPEDQSRLPRDLWVPISRGVADEGRVLPEKKRGPASAAIFAAMKNHMPLFRRVGIVTVFINMIAIVAAIFAMQVYDRVIPNFAYATLFVLASGVAVAYLFDLLFKVIRLKLLEGSARRLDEALSLYIFEKVMALKLDRRPSRVGSLVAQIRDYESIKAFFTSSTLFALADMPFIVLFIVVIYMIGGPVAYVLMAFVPLTILTGLIVYKPISRLQRDNNEEIIKRQGVLFEAIAGSETIKSQGGEPNFGNQWLRSTRVCGARGESLKTVSSYAQFATQLMQQLSFVGVLIVGVHVIEAGNLTTGGLIACSILSGRTLATISNITQLLLQWHNARYALDVLNQLLSVPSDESPQRQANTHAAPLDLSIKELKYAYEGAKVAQLVVPNLEIKAGERIAILGRNGGGKTTLVKLLAGLATPSGGEVRIAGLDMQMCRMSWLREVIGYLPQDVRLFSGTLDDNLTMGLSRPDEGRIMKALEASGLAAAVKKHPLGLQLPIREGGFGLSGGQRQLVGLTRLLLQNPRIWILDEPSASLDSEAEERLMNLVRSLPKDRTLIFTTHRPNWISLADRVLVIEDGLVKLDAPASKVRAMQKPRPATGAGASGADPGVSVNTGVADGART
ncbi:MAG: ATP-binding cassette domain-containing protein [Panacagrimonas sp.]